MGYDKIQRNLERAIEVLEELDYQPYCVTVRDDVIQLQGDWIEGIEEELKVRGFELVDIWKRDGKIFEDFVRGDVNVTLVKRNLEQEGR